MAKTKISEFSTTAGNNTDINSINIAEGCAPSGINDAIRELMRQLKEFQTGGAGDSVNSGGDFSVATNKFTVASASGNTAVAGTLGVTGAATLSSTLAVTGTTTLTGALVANGNATLGDGSGDTVTVKGTPTLEVNPTLSGGTANGVLYLNGSKVATSGSALWFDGTNLGIGDTAPSNYGAKLVVKTATNANFAVRSIVDTGGSSTGPAIDALNDNAGGVVPLGFRATQFEWRFASSDAMRLTSTGLGIGTSSPSDKLTVVSTSQYSGATIQGGTTTGASILTLKNSNSAGIWQIGVYGSGLTPPNNLYIYDGVNSAVRATIDTSGNLGLGVTPSAWNTIKAFEIGNVGNFFGGFTGDTSSYMGAGAYYNTGWKYAVSSKAVSKFEAQQGSFTWSIAPSGTAGNAISFTQAMTLTANGDLVLGATSAVARLDVRGKGYFETSTNPTNGAVLTLTNQTTTSNNGAKLVLDAYNIGTVAIGVPTNDSAIAFYCGPTTERARIDSSGNFLFNQSSAGYQNSNSICNDQAGFITINHIGGTSSGTSFVNFGYGASGIGSITQSGTSAVLYNVTSDQRLKENIADADSASTLIDSLQVRKFDWKADGNHQRYGFVAQELVTVAPEAVHQPADPEEMMAVDYSKLVPMLVKEIQSLRARVAQLESN